MSGEFKPSVNPYNFVSLKNGESKRGAPVLWHDLGELYTGRLVCTLEAKSPLFTADQRTPAPNGAGGQKVFRFLRNGADKPIIQGASIRGMVRSVFEAVTNSCLPLAATEGGVKLGKRTREFSFKPLGEEHMRCRGPESLCPACRLFGAIEGETLHLRGRVVFTDAVLDQGCSLQEAYKAYIRLAELSAPKPYHYAIYSGNGLCNGSIAGRKFYYHHEGFEEPEDVGDRWSKRACGIEEYAPSGARFDFDVLLNGLTDEELKTLVRVMVLEEGLGHKVGMARPLGFGSCSITIKWDESRVHRGGERYKKDGGESVKADELKKEAEAVTIPDELMGLLRLDKHEHAEIGYLRYNNYKGVGIDKNGCYMRGGHGGSGGSSVRVESSDKKSSKEDRRSANKRPPRRGDKLMVTMMGKRGDIFTLKPDDAECFSCRVSGGYINWRDGERHKVKVLEVGGDFRIKKVGPA